jgi:hypothetical protein
VRSAAGAEGHDLTGRVPNLAGDPHIPAIKVYRYVQVQVDVEETDFAGDSHGEFGRHGGELGKRRRPK